MKKLTKEQVINQLIATWETLMNLRIKSVKDKVNEKDLYDVQLMISHIIDNLTALESVREEEELDKRVIHINATPEFMADPKNIKLINDMVEKAGSVTIKKYEPIELKNLKNPE